MKKADVIDNSRIVAGNVIVGLSSSGKASYETAYNGGMGSNGLTSARHDVFSKEYASKYPESYDLAIDNSVVYSGKYKLTDEIKVDELNSISAGKLVLSPTRTYAPVIKKVFEKYRTQINGMVHCSGGGQTKILHFLDSSLAVIKDNLFEIPPLFNIIQNESQTNWQEMYKVFNMGHRMELYVDSALASEIIAISKSFDVDAKIIGRVVNSVDQETRLEIRSEKGIFKYN